MKLHEALQPFYLKKVGLKEAPKPSGDLNGIRVCQHEVCPVCQQPYSKHPHDTSLLFNDQPIFRLDCNGQRLKL